MYRTSKTLPFLFLSFSVLLSAWASSTEEEEVIEKEFKVKGEYVCTQAGCVPPNPVLEKGEINTLKTPLPANLEQGLSTSFNFPSTLYREEDPCPPQKPFSFGKRTHSALTPENPENLPHSYAQKCRRETSYQKNYPFTLTTSNIKSPSPKQSACQNRKRAILEFQEEQREQRKQFLAKKSNEQGQAQPKEPFLPPPVLLNLKESGQLAKFSFLPTLQPDFQPAHFPESHPLKDNHSLGNLPDSNNYCLKRFFKNS